MFQSRLLSKLTRERFENGSRLPRKRLVHSATLTLLSRHSEINTSIFFLYECITNVYSLQFLFYNAGIGCHACQLVCDNMDKYTLHAHMSDIYSAT